ncbi:large-conductance mechanosensitive channel protein MscL [Fontimonas thermophila]|nr:large-conductance mechanosensitive channel protein MscL [Fontimonas thermophila]
MRMIEEFKQFAMRGNVVDLAIGVVIGTAFGKIVSSLVADILMPVVGLFTGGIDFSDQVLILRAASGGQPAVVLGYGRFVQAVLDFVIVVFALFLVVKLVNRLRREEQAKPAAPSAQERLLAEIRDLLKKG